MTAAKDPTPEATSPSTHARTEVESISIQPVPPTPTSTTTVQEPAETTGRPVTRERFAARLRRLDVAAVGLVLVLAFFFGSFAAHNSDLWQHLATGRLIAHGQYTFGQDPFAYSVTGPDGPAPWMNPYWLYDWAVYEIAGAPASGLPAWDGAPLLIAKALLIAVLAGLLIRIRRDKSSPWIPLTVTALALFVMMPRLLLQPSIVSFVLLGLTLYLVQRPGHTVNGRPRFRARWLLPVVCLVWANLDSWFLLGPLVIGLYLLGELCQALLSGDGTESESASVGSLPTLGLIFVLSAAACLLNPTFLAHPQWDAATFVPTELLALLSPDSPVQQQAGFRTLFVDPLHSEYYQYYFAGATVWETPVALAYFVLLGLGIVSFALNFRDWRWSRAFVWLPLALLSLGAARAIPFFAVVAAPIIALNFQDFAGRYFAAAPEPGSGGARWALGGRILTVVAGVGLVVAAWPGWLYPGFDHPIITRHVAWRVAPNPSLQRSALALHDLYARGVLHTDTDNQPGTRGFNTSPDIASYCAWFCPEEKCYLDFRLNLYPEGVMSSYVQVCQALLPPARDRQNMPDELAPTEDWKDILKEAHVNHVVLHSGDRTTRAQALFRFWSQPQRWATLYADGQTAIFGWRDATNASGDRAFSGEYLNLNALAFGPHALRMPDDPPPPPQEAVSWVEKTVDFLRDYWQGPIAQPLQLDQVVLYQRLYVNDGRLNAQAYEWARLWAGLVTPATIPEAGASTPLEALNYTILGGGLAEYFQGGLARGQNFGPVAAPVLTVRLARAAVAANPQSATSYLALAEAYSWLQRTQEQPWMTADNPLVLLRRAQQVNALTSALALDPSLISARDQLAELYADMHYYDLAEAALKQNLDLVTAHGPRPGESDDDYERMLDQRDQRLQKLEKQWHVQKNQDLYTNSVGGQNPPVLLKLQAALQLGLAQTALQALEDAEPDQLGDTGKLWHFRLLLTMGRLMDAKTALEMLPQEESHTQAALYLGVLGDLNQADKFLEAFLTDQSKRASQGLAGLAEVYGFDGGVAPTELAGLTGVAMSVTNSLNWLLIRGVLALEHGDTAAAAEHFRAIVATTLPPMDEATRRGLLNGSIPLHEAVWHSARPSDGSWPGLDFDTRAVAYHYLPLLEKAGSK